MIKGVTLRGLGKYLPRSLRPLARSFFYRGRNPIHPELKKVGTVQDLYYWVSDGSLDTILLLQNYFSAIYPALDTETRGSITIYDQSGMALGSTPFTVANFGCVKTRVSSLLEQIHIDRETTFGTLEVNMAIPEEVVENVRAQKSVYFWDRFYIGYSSGLGQVCFVHGVDKTHIYSESEAQPAYWYKNPNNFQWAPEIPVDIEDYEKLTVVMINRTQKGTTTTLTLSDRNDCSSSWSAEIPPRGVYRFQLNASDTAGLESTELRMRVAGMATKFGRPLVFKEFRNGAISAMHC